jgi:hypothetical protein
MFKATAEIIVFPNGSASNSAKTVFVSLYYLAADPFGKTMISAVALNMQAKAPLDDIQVVIDQLISNLEADQNAADAKNATDAADCEQTIGELQAQIVYITQ